MQLRCMTNECLKNCQKIVKNKKEYKKIIDEIRNEESTCVATLMKNLLTKNCMRSIFM